MYDDHDSDDYDDDDEIQLVICELWYESPENDLHRVIRKLLTHIRHFVLKHPTAVVPELFRFTAPLAGGVTEPLGQKKYLTLPFIK